MSAIEVVIEPGRTVDWDVFKVESAQHDVGAMALDGYVSGAPAFDRIVNHEGRILSVKNFNHHEDVERLATLATCAQVDLAIKSGLTDAFRDVRGNFAAKVFVNDSDQDVCAAVWLLRHKELVLHTGNPMVTRFVTVAGIMDMTAGSYPFDGDSQMLRELNWINDPYNRARLTGEATSSDPEVHRSIIDSVGERISKHIAGRGDSKDLDMRFDPLDKGNGWTMIREVGPQGKLGAINEGAKALIQIRDQDPEHIHVSFWRQSEYVPLDFPKIMERLRERELEKRIELGLVPKETRELSANWGGGTTTFGSPRIIGTVLDKDEIGAIADEFSIAY